MPEVLSTKTLAQPADLKASTWQRNTCPGSPSSVLNRPADGWRVLYAAFGEPRRWCAIAALSAGQPARLTGDEIYREMCADGYLARTCRDLLHDESVYGVTGGRADSGGLTQSGPEYVGRMGRQTIAYRGPAAHVSLLVQMLEGQVVDEHFARHPAADIYLSQPGFGVVLAARTLGEFGDDKDRFATARARKNYSGQSPITRASGKKSVVLARYATNRRLGAALHLQAFAALGASPGARAYYDAMRARNIGHHAALRQLANRSSACCTAA